MALSEESVHLSDTVPHPRWSVTGPLPQDTETRDLVGIILQMSFQPGLLEKLFCSEALLGKEDRKN